MGEEKEFRGWNSEIKCSTRKIVWSSANLYKKQRDPVGEAFFDLLFH